jgi:NodT family efflux transporter outer membrane factor (OMF) lipoprotein
VDAGFSGGGGTAPGSDEAWWKRLGDPVLDQLVDEALAQNLELGIAEARIEEARALRRQARAALFPNLAGRVGYTNVGISETQDVVVNPGPGLFPAFPDQGENWATGFEASWEVDVFGGNRRRVQGTAARIGAAEEAAHGVRLILVAEVLDSYYALAGIREQEARVRSNIALQRETTDLVGKLHAEGLRSELDLRRANAQLASTEAVAPNLDGAEVAQLRRLCLLLGRKPTYLDGRADSFRGFPRRLPASGTGLTADLLMRRPDLRQAERSVAAATADIGAATANFYPRFILFGSPQLASGSSGNLFDVASLAWNAGPRVEWSLFTAGANQALLAGANARQKQALLAFEQAVLAAVGEVETNLAQVQSESRRLAALERAARETRASVGLAKKLYQDGLQDLLTVLVEEQRLIATELDEVSSRTALTASWIRLHKALGGGWD